MTRLTRKKTKSNSQILEQLSGHSLNQKLMNHEVLRKFRQEPIKEEEVTFILSQYWYPLNNFPHFLSGLIHCTERLEIQTFVSNILWQELGEGKYQRSHSEIYKTTMSDVGLNLEKICNGYPLKETTSLVEGFNLPLQQNYLKALGCLYSTEVSDLKIVSSIGKAVENYTKIQKLPWVTIHVVQEPDHVENVEQALSCEFDSHEENELMQGAEEMFTLWINFFDAIGNYLKI
jgi:pyrroloquinoline quinone (PQQ) biosynthesis protein C